MERTKNKEKILKERQVIDRVFLNKPWKSITYSDIQELSGKKSKSFIYSAINRLKQENLIEFKKIGKRTIIYNAKLNTTLSQTYWGFLNEYNSWNKKKIPFKIIENLRAKIPTSFFCLIVTGSYAKDTYTSKSDLDVVIISNIEPKTIYSELKLESETSMPKVHLFVFKEQEFLSMLLDKKDNYGKEICKNNLIFYGGASYYSILSDAIYHGFKG
jgi:hypothetical protein